VKLKELERDLVDRLKYDEKGLIPAIIQDFSSGRVLMLAYMNRASLKKTLETGRTWFYSRSRQRLWQKGETSGNYQEVRDIYYDCDADAVLVKVKQHGSACHTGEMSCFYNHAAEGENEDAKQEANAVNGVIDNLYGIISQRYRDRPQGSYTTYLFNEGQDKILKKVGEEATEVILGSKNQNKNEIIYEMADLLYHCLVLLVFHGILPREVLEELNKRRIKKGRDNKS